MTQTVERQSPSAEPEQIPLITIRPLKGFNPIPFGELYQFRDLLVTLAVRDLRLRYRQTILGVLWVILPPLAGAGIFTFVFGTIAKLPSDGVPYFIFALAGQLGWNLFSSTVSKSTTSLISNAHLVSKVYFPRLIIPFSQTLTVFVDFAIGFALLLVVMPLLHVPYTWNIFALPVCIVLAFMMALGLGNYSAALTAKYRDMMYVTPMLVQFLAYASPVAYTAKTVPASFRWLYNLNPVAGLMEFFRWCLLGTPISNWGFVLYAALFSIAIFAAGCLTFQKVERTFADVI